MSAFLIAVLLAGPINVPDTAVNFTVKSARPATVFNSLSQMAGATIDASCLGDARFGLNVQSIPLPVLFDLLSTKLNVRFEGLDGGVIHAVCSKDPDVPSAGLPGAVLAELPASVKQFFGTGEAGVLVRGVFPQSIAAAVGLRENDVLTAIDGKPVGSLKDVDALMSKKHGAVQKTDLTLLRDQQSWSLAMVVQPGTPNPAASVLQKQIEERNAIHDSAVRGDGEGLPTLTSGQDPMGHH